MRKPGGGGPSERHAIHTATRCFSMPPCTREYKCTHKRQHHASCCSRLNSLLQMHQRRLARQRRPLELRINEAHRHAIFGQIISSWSGKAAARGMHGSTGPRAASTALRGGGWRRWGGERQGGVGACGSAGALRCCRVQAAGRAGDGAEVGRLRPRAGALAAAQRASGGLAQTLQRPVTTPITWGAAHWLSSAPRRAAGALPAWSARGRRRAPISLCVAPDRLDQASGTIALSIEHARRRTPRRGSSQGSLLPVSQQDWEDSEPGSDWDSQAKAQRRSPARFGVARVFDGRALGRGSRGDRRAIMDLFRSEAMQLCQVRHRQRSPRRRRPTLTAAADANRPPSAVPRPPLT